jgi:hypothetical protein
MSGLFRHRTWPFLAVIASLGCRGPRSQSVSLERTACYGICPVYKVTIGADGVATYEGESFVKVKGRASAKVSSADLDGLRVAFEKVDFFALQDSYEKRIQSDAPTAIVSRTDGGRTKTVRHYEGDATAPAELRWLEKQIDGAVHIEQWTGSDEERLKNVTNWK